MTSSTADERQRITELARAARRAARIVGQAPSRIREAALRAVGGLMRDASEQILEANAADMQAGLAAGLSRAMLDRLYVDADRLDGMARAVEAVAGMPDPIGAVEGMERRPNGLLVGKMRIPLGVICMIYESRPNVTTDAFAVCLRSANACILRGGKEALHTNQALAAVVQHGLVSVGLPPEACQLVPTADREAFLHLLEQDDHIDLVIPRGGEGLIRFVSEHSRIPVIRHYKGVCHVYVDAAASPEMALDICENAKASRPGVCNACETILVHDAVADTFIPALVERLSEAGVEIRGDARTQALGGVRVAPATEEDYHQEYLDLIVAVRTVASVEEAVEHIETYGSNHTEAIVTSDYATARRFVDRVQSSTVLVNASTRFADGGELGLGAEIGISTSKLHAYGPMGARELTTTKFVVYGDGQIRR